MTVELLLMLSVVLLTAIVISIGWEGIYCLTTLWRYRQTPSPKTKTEPTVSDSRDS
jgi:multisubunit Na+/H+ antiporter MnhC subunit